MATDRSPNSAASGDVLIFSGRKPFSWLIRWRSCSRFSHVGICCETTAEDLARSRTHTGWGLSLERELSWQPQRLLYESTSLHAAPCVLSGRRTIGAQAHDLAGRIAAYDGRVWRLPLICPLTDHERQRLVRILLDAIGTGYDLPGALAAGTLGLKRWLLLQRTADRATYFCCEMVLVALAHAICSPSLAAVAGTLTPAALVRRLRRLGLYGKLEVLK